MKPTLKQSEAIAVDVVAQVPALALGPFSIDPIRLLTGAALADILGELMRGPVYRRGNVEVYPLTLPEGEGLSVPIRGFGALGFRNLRGLFILIVPAALAGTIAAELAQDIQRGDANGPRFDPGSDGQTAEFAIKVRPGMRFPIRVGTFEIALETPR